MGLILPPPWANVEKPLLPSSDTLIRKAGALFEKGLLAEARPILEELIITDVNNVEALSLLGQICGSQLDHSAAIGYLEAARNIDPKHMEVLFSLGIEYRMASRHQESLAILDLLIATYPKIGTFHDHRGLVLRELGCDSEAGFAFEEALRLAPADAGAMVNFANLLLKSCAFNQAENLLSCALTLKPDFVAAHNELGRLYYKQGRQNLAIEQFRLVLDLESDNRTALSNILYCQCYMDNMSPEAIAGDHFSICDKYFTWGHQQKEINIPHRPAGTRLRVGYISGDFGMHPVTSFFEPILLHHDAERFQIFCYSNRSAPDSTTRRLQGLNVSWRDIYGLFPRNVADLIADDGIDVLVDLSGHSAGNRTDVCALKPAPVLATWLGYPHSTGMRQFDYYISDAICDPPGTTDHLYCEQVWRLPRVFCCYTPPIEFPVISPSPREDLGRITFGSFNNLAKVSDTVIRLWSDVLHRVPESRLLLKSASLGGQSTQQQLQERFGQYGIPPERIMLKVHTQKLLDHLAMYAQVDIALDTYPYHGTTTTCEALWMGVPVVTLAGRSHLARVGASLLTHVGLPELVASSPEEYVACAAELAQDKARLKRLRFALRGMMAESPLMDAAGVTREVEEAYVKMFDSVSRRTGLGSACHA